METADGTILAESSEKKRENESQKKKSKTKYVPRSELTEEERLRERAKARQRRNSLPEEERLRERAKARQRRNSLPEEKKRQMYERQRQIPNLLQYQADYRRKYKEKLLEQLRLQSPEFMQEYKEKREIHNARLRLYWKLNKDKVKEKRRQTRPEAYLRDRDEINERKRLKRANLSEEKRKVLQCQATYLRKHRESNNEGQCPKGANLTEEQLATASIRRSKRIAKIKENPEGGQRHPRDGCINEEPKEDVVEMCVRDDAFESSREYDIVKLKVESSECDDRIDISNEFYVNGAEIVEIKTENTLSDGGK